MSPCASQSDRPPSPPVRIADLWARLRIGLVAAGVVLAGAAQAADGAAPAAPQAVADGAWRHGLSLLDDVKEPPGFSHFSYVNPDAPKGGLVRLGAEGSFDTLNPVPVQGVVAQGIGYVTQTLMERAEDEPATQYGGLAEAVRVAPDLGSVTYRLNAAARWADGQPVTPEDVAFSLDALKTNNPQYGFYFRDVTGVERSGEREVTFHFARGGNRELPQIVGEMPVFPKHWWTGTGPDGKPRDIARSTLEPPLGSGPYRVAAVQPGRSITYERVKDWWGAALPTSVGRYNFDRVRIEYFLDHDVLREAFKADAFDFRLENIAKDWNTAYDIPAVRDGRIVRQEFPNGASGIMQGFGFNLRRTKFADPRVRRAFNLGFDFESLNRDLFFGLYTRIDSYFDGTDLAASGLPQGRELTLLDAVKDKIPPAVFTTPYTNPVAGTPEALRANQREALRLFREAGWEVKGGALTNVTTGETMRVELLIDSPSMERVGLAWRPALARLGIDLAIRTVDAAQYQARVASRDFDMIVLLRGESLSPGNEQREYWGSAAADRQGSGNQLGIKDAGVDALIDQVVYARSRDDLVAATHALDRVLLAGAYVVPHWRSATWRTLRWNRFSGPATLPDQSLTGGFPDVWWYDDAKAAKTGKAP